MKAARDAMTPEERVELEDLLYAVGYDDGELVPSAEIGPRMVEALTGAAQAGRRWAQWILDDNLEHGCRDAWKHWHNKEKQTRVLFGGRLVAKPALRSVRLQSPAEPGGYWQPMMYEDMTAAELHDLVRRSRTQIEAERINIATANKLLGALQITNATTVGEAMGILGVSVDAYLGNELAA